jgi:DNA polymerase-3 subunit epsilon
MGDVLATWEFVQHASKELGEDVVNEAIEHCIKRIELPPQLPSDILDQIPQLPGVYRFFDAHNNLLHMGKNKNLYQRIQSHFGRDNQSAKALQLAEQLHRIEWTETAGELGAVLLEQQQLKEYPDFAHAQSLAPSISYVVHENNQDYQCLRLVDYIDPSVMGEHIGAFTTPRQAAKALAQIAKSYQLCPLLLGLTPDRHSCGEFPNGYCKGACCGQEDSIKYNLRQQDAVASLKLKPWPWKGPILIQQKSDFSGLQESHLVQNWTYLHTWTQSGCHDEDDDLNHALTEFLEQPIDWQEKFSLAHYKLFNKWLFDPKQTLKIIPL